MSPLKTSATLLATLALFLGLGFQTAHGQSAPFRRGGGQLAAAQLTSTDVKFVGRRQAVVLVIGHNTTQMTARFAGPRSCRRLLHRWQPQQRGPDLLNLDSRDDRDVSSHHSKHRNQEDGLRPEFELARDLTAPLRLNWT